MAEKRDKMNLNRKHYVLILSGIIVLFFGILFYITLPYTNNWRSQYSLYLETKADSNPDKQKALLQYLEADLLSDSELLSLKIGQLYDDAGKLELAEKYFTKVKSSKYLNDLTEHYLKAGDIEKAKTIIKKTKDEYYTALTTFITDPKEAQKNIQDLKGEKSKILNEYIETFMSNPQTEYTDTAIALYLYNNGYNKLALDKLEHYNDSNYKDAVDLLGDIYFSQSQYKEASDAFEKSIALDSYDVEIYKKLLSVYEKLGKDDKLKEVQIEIRSLSVIDK